MLEGLKPDYLFELLNCYYWIKVIAEETLSYVGKRLMVLDKEKKKID